MLEAVDRGIPRREVAEILGVSMLITKRRLRRRETREVQAKPDPGPPVGEGTAPEESPPPQLQANPDFTPKEHRESYLKRLYGISVSTSNIGRTFERLGLPLKSRSR